MKKWLILVMVLIGVSIVYLSFRVDVNFKKEYGGEEDIDLNENDSGEESGVNGIGEDIDRGSEDNSMEEELPSDLYTQECGYYFEDYGVCGGTCPQGECVQEGRSCYCKK